MIRVRALVKDVAADALALGGLLLVAYGFGQWPGWGTVLGPVVLGLGLLATVRFGTR
jgi:hypothetical protein